MAAAKGKDKNEKQVRLDQLQGEINEAPQRNLTGSLEQCKEELQNAYMRFKENRNRCKLKIMTGEFNDKQVYYFKPDTFLMDNPTNQRFYRESLLKKISAIPKPEPIYYLGDEMHRAFVATVADQSHPPVCKKNLAMYFKRRQYAL